MQDSAGSKILLWQWASISSGVTLILLIAGFGLFKLVRSDAEAISLEASPTNLQQALPKPSVNSVPQRQTSLDATQATLSAGQIRAREHEVISLTGSMNRAQQAFFLKKEQFSPDVSKFSSELSLLGQGIPLETAAYSYQIRFVPNTSVVQNIGLAKLAGLRSTTGIVYRANIPTTGEVATLSRLCISDEPTLELPSEPRLVNGEVTCPTGYSPLN